MKTIIKEELILFFIHILFFVFVFHAPMKFGIRVLILSNIVIVGVFLCRHVLILPVDLINGRSVGTFVFTGIKGVNDYEFSKDKSYNLGFYDGKKTLFLTYNEPKDSETDQFEFFVNSPNTKMEIEYYRYSKILLRWNVIDQCNESNLKLGVRP